MSPVPSDFSSFIRQVICYNQAEYIQYSFEAGERHKTLKDALRISPKDVEKHRELCGQLEEFLNKKLYGVSLQNFRSIKAYFRGRHEKEPRLCIKGHYTKGEKDHIVQLIRDKSVNYPSEYPVEDNSGFLFIKNSGQCFKCDDIPRDIADLKYHNARIDTNLARVYYEQKKAASPKSPDNQGFHFDESWVRCWIHSQDAGEPPSPVDPTSCYKSTIIIPITLWNNKLAPSFLVRLREKQKRDIHIEAKTIFGYLCFDHVEEHYFNDDVDIDVGYIFADILSLYMITGSIYTGLSTTYSKVMQLHK